MAGPFQARRGGALEVFLSDVEADVIRGVASELLGALRAPGTGETERLFPPGYEDDLTLEEEFRAMTRDELLEHKLASARTVISSLDAGKRRRGAWQGRLDPEQAQAWLTLMNDARLVLGTRLNVTEDMNHAPLAASDPDARSHNMYLYLSALEEQLVEALLESETAEGEPTA